MFQGELFTNAQGSAYKVIEYRHAKDVLVRFIDEYQYETSVSAWACRSGKVRNPYTPSAYGVGFVGTGRFKLAEGKKLTTFGGYWLRMLERCYGARDKNVSYEGCHVVRSWHNFQNFAKWCSGRKDFVDTWHLDKDIILQDNKEYGPVTCCFLPPDVNMFTTKRNSLRGEYPIGVCLDKKSGKFLSQGSFKGFSKKYLGSYDSPEEAFEVYRKHKEEHGKFLAEKWKGEISEEAYYGLLNYKV